MNIRTAVNSSLFFALIQLSNFAIAANDVYQWCDVIVYNARNIMTDVQAGYSPAIVYKQHSYRQMNAQSQQFMKSVVDDAFINSSRMNAEQFANYRASRCRRDYEIVVGPNNGYFNSRR